jgi:hypothetical protein
MGETRGRPFLSGLTALQLFGKCVRKEQDIQWQRNNCVCLSLVQVSKARSRFQPRSFHVAPRTTHRWLGQRQPAGGLDRADAKLTQSAKNGASWGLWPGRETGGWKRKGSDLNIWQNTIDGLGSTSPECQLPDDQRDSVTLLTGEIQGHPRILGLKKKRGQVFILDRSRRIGWAGWSWVDGQELRVVDWVDQDFQGSTTNF